MIKQPKVPVLEAVKHLKSLGCYYNPEKGGIYSKNHKPKGHLATNGYKIVSYEINKEGYYFCEHRIVWWWFHPNDDESLVIDHINSDRGDNRIENLDICTQKENTRRVKERGRDNPCNGEKSPKTNLTDRDARVIRYLSQNGWPRKDIADLVVGNKAKAPSVTVNRIIEKTRFGHLDDPSEIWEVYPSIVMMTSPKNLSENEQISNAIAGMCGELGEVSDILKKYLFHGHELNRDHLIEELGDLIYYITWLEVCILGIDRAEVLLHNMCKLQNRYPDGFDPEKSIHREEYEV